MKYRRLGKTDLRVSVIGIGTWQFGGEWGKDFTQLEVDRIFNAARETGINLIDTAECYGDHLSERFVGAAIRRDREKWIVATKFGHKFHSHMNRTDERTAADMIVQVEDSLKASRPTGSISSSITASDSANSITMSYPQPWKSCTSPEKSATSAIQSPA